MDEFSDIIKKMASTPTVEPPPDFTAKVMERVLQEPVGILDRFRQILSPPREHIFAFQGLLSAASTRNECAFFYILAGSFYLIFGLVLMLGFADAGGEGTLAKWILLQPQLMIIAAIWLSGLGGIVSLSNRINMSEVAKIATMIFVLFVFLSGAIVIVLCQMPVLMAATGFFVISGVVIGFLLLQNISHYQESLPN